MTLPVTGNKPEVIILSEVSETGKDKCHRISLLVESKTGYKWTSLQKRNRFTEKKFTVTQKDVVGGRKWLAGSDQYIHLKTGAVVV